MTAARKTPSLLDQLTVFDEAVASAVTRGRALRAKAAEHAAMIERLKRERVDAYSTDDERKASALRKKEQDAFDKNAELALRQQGADVAERRAQVERDKFIAEHHTALVNERVPIATEAVEMIEDAVAKLAEGVRLWHAEAQIQSGLLRPVGGRDGREIPDLPIVGLVRDLAGAVEPGIPPPLPRLTAVKPTASPKPDPTSWPAAPVVKLTM